MDSDFWFHLKDVSSLNASSAASFTAERTNKTTLLIMDGMDGLFAKSFRIN